MSYQYKCENCGAVKETKYKSQAKRFCSHKCANEYQWKTKPQKRISITCQTCGKVFEVIPGDHRLKNNGIKYCSKECANEGLKSGKIASCKECGKEFYTTRHQFCSRECASIYRSKHAPKKTYKENGYLVVHIKGYNKKGNAKLHRVIMEEFLGRKLSADEVVHHINGDKTDNRIENLMVMSRDEHSLLHRQDDMNKGKQLFK